MSAEDYAWFLAFGNDETYEAVAQLLLDQGSFDGESVSFLCPDGVKRHVIQCAYDTIAEVRDSVRRAGRGGKFKYYVMRKTLPDGTVEFWPPGQEAKRRRALEIVALRRNADIITAAELLKRQQELSKPRKPKPPTAENDPPPF